MSEGASFETERHRDDQPVRDDLLDPEEIDPQGEVVGDEVIDDEAGVIPDPEELPESQGDDVLTAERLSEDATEREPLHDEDL